MSSPTRWIREGCIAGLIAFAAVAVFYALIDIAAGRGALFTVNLLGQALLGSPVEAAARAGTAAVDAVAVVVYSVLHLAAAIGIGLLVARLVREAELRPMQAQVALLFIVAGFAGTIALVGALTAPLRANLPWWSIIAANSLAVLLAGLVLIRRHPGFLEEMTVNPRYPAA